MVSAHRPTSVTELAACLAAGSEAAVPVALVGGGAFSGRGQVPTRVEATIDCSGLDSRIDHAEADLTAIVSAGVRLGDLQARLAEAGQMLALDPPVPSEAEGQATVGALVAAGASGPLRHRFGTPRDLVIGATFVLADGTVAHTGGRVIKNVAGYDLAKVLSGSLGTLAAIAEVAIRLHPALGATVSVGAPASAAQAVGALEVVEMAGLEPVAADVARGSLWLRFAGRAAAAQAVQACELLAGSGLAPELFEDDDNERWADLARCHLAPPGGVSMHSATRRSRLGALEAAATSCERATGVPVEVAAHLGVAVADLVLAPAPLEALAEAVGHLRSALEGQALGSMLLGRPAGLDELVDPLGPPPDATAAMGALASALDPTRRLNPGRFAPWW